MSDVIDTDRIERSVHIKGSRERVWRALTNAAEFRAWFGADLSGQALAPGRRASPDVCGTGRSDAPETVSDAVQRRR
jgi:uncharacterized protein YndB with AHSA1/START domain